MPRPATRSATRRHGVRHPGLALAAAGLLLVTACAGGEGDRVAQLEQELEQAHRDNEELQARIADLDEQLAGQPDGGGEPGGDAPGQPGEGGEGGGASGEPEQPWTPEGLTDQLRTLFPPSDPPEGWTPGTTDWEPFDLPDGFADAVHEELGLVGVALLEVLEGPALGLNAWESTVRALPDDDPDRGEVAVLSWGIADDAVQGRDVRVTVTRSADGWQAEGAEVRHHCARGVTDDDLCV